MKDFSLFLIKNALGAKMKKGFRNFCNSEISTSTLDQNRAADPRTLAVQVQPVVVVNSPSEESHPTLEEMIMKLEMEERILARSSKALNDGGGVVKHRMSCVNSSDILRSARNALDQYPRFSLDGKDAMYRCSFADAGPVKRNDQTMLIPGREGSVIWCNPGVVAKLMGLDAIPVPVNTRNHVIRGERLSAP